ncbi:MAG: virulence factor SrfB [Desulfovibrio sp.]|nr:virulence factor SrfB [Desulfovibrio sp.]
MPRYKNPISLIPFGLPQLLDYETDRQILGDIYYNFEEKEGKAENGARVVHLHAFAMNEDGEFIDEMDGSVNRGGGYPIGGDQAIEPWLNQWLPIPFLRAREQYWPGTKDPRFELGPTNWARARVAPHPQDPGKLRLVIAFDMKTETRTPEQYPALTMEDVNANARFRLAWRFRDNAWYMDLAWVDEWLKEIWKDWRAANNYPPEEENQFEYLASYLVYLAILNKICANCEVKVILPGQYSAIEVDLVLDIGNSRTTGMLVETQTQQATSLTDSYLLQLRDMSAPENVYTDPFETRVEFSEVVFGNSALDMRSGRRTPAFSWPSPVRMGPEANRLARLSLCGEGSTGMSSPKRYLWDERDWLRSWRFNTGTEKAPFVTRGPLAQEINSSGTPLVCLQEDPRARTKAFMAQEQESAFESYFTRSSLMMFLFVEIIQQALMTINQPGQRCRSDLDQVPRRLRQIIFTVPPGMPMAEQKIYVRWAEWAVRVLWLALGWESFYVENPKNISGKKDYRTSPLVRCEWDEATCTQLVYIYNEITGKFQGDALFFCDTEGARRDIGSKNNVPSVRVATIDIGGGTTDLSITTFELEKESGSTPRLLPHPEFHDGFNVAGDDILRDIVENHVCAAVVDALMKLGFPDREMVLKSLFGRELMDTTKDARDQRVQFIRQIAVPVALNLMELYEKADLRSGSGKISFTLRDCFQAPPGQKTAKKDESGGPDLDIAKNPYPSQAALAYIPNYLRSAMPGTAFDVLDTPISMNPRELDGTVRKTLKRVFENMCEVINKYDCDALLLTGRPSKWPAIIDSINELTPVPPSRVIPMIDCRMGSWYPFSDATGHMTDPKTTVVVGAILSALAEGSLEGFAFETQLLKLSSTARYIGIMEQTGQLKKDNLWFEVDPDDPDPKPLEKEIIFNNPIPIGFRQLDNENWTTTRYYYLDWAGDGARGKDIAKTPLSVTLQLEVISRRRDKDNNLAVHEGEFSIKSVKDAAGMPKGTNILEARLQTLPRNEGFWMDTGVIVES